MKKKLIVLSTCVSVYMLVASNILGAFDIENGSKQLAIKNIVVINLPIAKGSTPEQNMKKVGDLKGEKGAKLSFKPTGKYVAILW
ncbi:hypothetical protein ACFLYU_03330 [Candidatus Dependentiae bacterium]